MSFESCFQASLGIFPSPRAYTGRARDFNMFHVFSLGYPLKLDFTTLLPRWKARNFSKSHGPCKEDHKYMENMREYVGGMTKFVENIKK